VHTRCVSSNCIVDTIEDGVYYVYEHDVLLREKSVRFELLLLCQGSIAMYVYRSLHFDFETSQDMSRTTMCDDECYCCSMFLDTSCTCVLWVGSSYNCNIDEV